MCDFKMADFQIFTDSHAKSILATMNNLRKTNTLCDVTLNVQGQKFPAHRIVLAACSDYFCAMFTNEMSERDQSEITLYEISASVVRVLLDFCYTETVNVSVENVQELLPAACLLQLTGVREACCQFLEKQLDSTNCLGIKIFAERHGCEVLWAAADRFSVRHFENVVTQEEFKSLPKDEVEALVKSDHLQVNSEEPVYHAVLDWVKHDEKGRMFWLSSLLQFVRLPLLSACFITDVIDNEVSQLDNEPLIRGNHACRDLVDEAKRFHLRPDLRSHMNGPRTSPRFGTDDQLVVVGGFGSHQNLVDVVEKYDPKSHSWTRLPNLSRRRRYVSAASLGGKLFVMGGYDGHSRLNLAECLDLTQTQLSWTPISQMHHRRGLACVCVYKEGIYMCGGFDGHTRHTSMERYDPRTDKWAMLSGMAVGREGAGLVVAGDMIYCIGGYDGISLLDSAERYDPGSEQWTSIPCMAIQRSGAGVAVVNEVIYVCGGYDGNDHLSSVESFNTQTNHWTTLHPMVVPRCYVGACVLRGQLMVVAGYDGNTLLNTVEVYDPLRDIWDVLDDSMAVPRCDAGVCVVRMP